MVLEPLPDHQLSWFPQARHKLDTFIAALLLCIAYTAFRSTGAAGDSSSDALPGGLQRMPHGKEVIQVLAKHPGLPLLLAREVARAVADTRDSLWAHTLQCVKAVNLVLAGSGLWEAAEALCAGSLPRQLLEMLQMMADQVGSL